MPDRFDHDPVARLEAAKAAHRSMFTGDPGNGPRTTAIEDVLIAQLVEARSERDRYEAALFKIVELWFDKCPDRPGKAVVELPPGYMLVRRREAS